MFSNEQTLVGETWPHNCLLSLCNSREIDAIPYWLSQLIRSLEMALAQGDAEHVNELF